MAKALRFVLGEAEFHVSPEKVDRAKLYGRIDTEVVDADGRPCELATLAPDGRTLIGRGGIALGMLSVDGEWLDKKDLVAVDPEGREVHPVPSSFDAPIPLLTEASVEEYLTHDVKSVYRIEPADGSDLSALVAKLMSGTIYTFPYSFRSSLVAAVGFLLAAQDGTPFLAVSVPTRLRFVGLDDARGFQAEEEDDEDETASDELDFGSL